MNSNWSITIGPEAPTDSNRPLHGHVRIPILPLAYWNRKSKEESVSLRKSATDCGRLKDRVGIGDHQYSSLHSYQSRLSRIASMIPFLNCKLPVMISLNHSWSSWILSLWPCPNSLSNDDILHYFTVSSIVSPCSSSLFISWSIWSKAESMRLWMSESIFDLISLNFGTS